MKVSKPMKTLMHASNPLRKYKSGKLVDKTNYKDMIDWLLYLTASRPDIMYSVCLFVRFQFDPRESHLKAIKKILCSLVCTNQNFFYKKNQDFKLVGYYDADYAYDKVEWKSTNGGCLYIGPCDIMGK